MGVICGPAIYRESATPWISVDIREPGSQPVIKQPTGTSLSIFGNFDLSNANVIGFSGGGGGGTGIGIAIGGSNVNATSINFGSTPAAPSGSVNVTWQRDALNPASASAYISSATTSSLGLVWWGRQRYGR